MSTYNPDALYGTPLTVAEIDEIRRNNGVSKRADLIAHEANQFEATHYEELQKHSQILPVATGARALQLVLELARKHRRAANFAITFSALFSGLGAIATYLVRHLVDTVQGVEPEHMLFVYAGAIAAAGILSGVFSALNDSQVGQLGQGILVQMRDRVLFNALNIPAGRLEKAGAGDALSRVADDVNQADSTVRNVIPTLVGSVLTLVFSLLGLSVLDWRLGLVGLAVTPLYGLALRWYLPRSRPLHRQRREAMGHRTQALLGCIYGLKTVHAYGVEARQLGVMDGISRIFVTLVMRNTSIMARLVLRLRIAEFLGITGILVASFYLYQSGYVTLGVVTASALFFVQLFGPMEQLVWLADDIQSGGASLVRLVGVYDMPLEAEPEIARSPRDAALSVHEVSHEYIAGRTVLHPTSLRIEPGETVAFVGASGAGKSTLAAIIAGTLTPSSGEVRYGGVPLADIPVAARRRHIALVSQSVHVFRGTLADDLRLARENATDTELWAALETVAADTWVRRLPQGIETLVGERGVPLTAEQAQHLALARLVLADPPIVIMDEATASAGAGSDAADATSDPSVTATRTLERAAQRVAAGRTTIVIAHRLSQAETADRIFVMDAGAIVEHGTHTELLAARGTYAALWNAWSGSNN